MDDRVLRLMDKAEQAADRGDTEQADTFRVLAGQAAYFARQEVKMLNRIPVKQPDE